ncbi:MAG TPA: serine acetyltransferase [Syntrophorhabdus sp.]|jgi:serine O-acetyltransferase|nr:serine acetyltransferase [Syntrophorhabdus sp.]OPX96745.1 MAG: Serine acetyltransferase [Syntrophorhabdus sp. PtaB.Bin027]OQB74966.1 MAG: Serine acetyltransferase [Deltaproteobacteria bacterium ADurb.Bin135]HOD77816.1 serine acetyltransferase [Syntrophorhabdus sp.]HQG26823.1 serine acetyltransferase [Syntrophorhabdus sp.]
MERHDLKNYLRADLYRYNGAKALCYFLKALTPSLPAFRYTYLLRHASVFKKYSIRGLFYRVLLNHYSYKYGFQIMPNTKIGKGLYIGHRGTVVINGQTEIGDNCTLTHLVTIGQANRGERKGCPKIGERVWIGAGAVVVGKITIGDNVLIAPNSYVNFDVPSNSMVAGNPAVVKPHNNPTEGYIKYVFSESNQDVT